MVPGARLGALVAVVGLFAAACSAGTGSVQLSSQLLAPADPSVDGVDEALADIEDFWADAMPEVYGISFEPVAAAIGYDAAEDPLESIPSCDTEVEDRIYAENAFYCPTDDTILFDEGVLFPEISASIGPFAVATVLAHEYGHAIQARVGLFDDSSPPINGVVLELQADCFAGAWVADLHERTGDSESQVDEAISGLVFVRDPVGTAVTEPGAHGNAFDRVNAFSDGLFEGPVTCAGYLANPPDVTAREFQANERLTQGNLAVEQVVPLVVSGLEVYWSTEFETLFGDPYDPPTYVAMAPRTQPPPLCGGLEQDPAMMEGLVTYCTAEGTIVADQERLLPSLAAIGDFAVTYPIVHAWSQQVLLQGLGSFPPRGVILSGDCVSGAWTRAVFEGQQDLGLSAGDIDEAVIGFGVYTPTAPDGSVLSESVATIERVDAFADGFFDGAESCLG